MPAKLPGEVGPLSFQISLIFKKEKKIHKKNKKDNWVIKILFIILKTTWNSFSVHQMETDYKQWNSNSY